MMRAALFLLLLPECAQGATKEELEAASEDLQQGVLDEHGLEIFRSHALTSPADWRVHAMLGQALGQKGLPGAVASLRTAHRLAPYVGQLSFSLASELRKSSDLSDAAEAVRLYRAAIKATPSFGTDAETYVQMGFAAVNAVKVNESSPVEVQDDDEAVEAWNEAAALAPSRPDVLLLLAARLAHGGKALRKDAIRAAENAVRLAPQSARAYDTLGSALVTATTPKNLTKKQRTRLIKTLRTAIALHGDGDADSNEAGAASSAALTHHRLARSLSVFPGVMLDDAGVPTGLDESITSRMSEVVHHVRQAARLDSAFAKSAAAYEGWEDALRSYKHADYRSQVQREGIVKALHEQVSEKRLQAEEDEAIAEEAMRDKDYHPSGENVKQEL